MLKFHLCITVLLNSTDLEGHIKIFCFHLYGMKIAITDSKFFGFVIGGSYISIGD
jgi:hypothetical protein